LSAELTDMKLHREYISEGRPLGNPGEASTPGPSKRLIALAVVVAFAPAVIAGILTWLFARAPFAAVLAAIVVSAIATVILRAARPLFERRRQQRQHDP
jgi:VIT1/CCC1 family predicted Fe2+/Mn2+ transporter